MKANQYKAIAAWGKMMQSFSSYVKMEQERAMKDKAPIDAIYQDSDGKWNTVEDISNEETKRYIKSLI